MTSTEWLITGGAGQLARDLALRLPDAVVLSRDQLDITDSAAVEDTISRLGPKVVFNCAAYNAVDRAETEPDLAFAINATGPGNVARACRRHGGRLVHFSTNYVFDGTADHPYTESDEPNPLGVYGRSKREGELAVLEELEEPLIIRSSGLFGAGGSAVKGGSFPDRILARARAGQGLTVVDDQRLNPTFTGHLAWASILAAQKPRTGILHLVAGGCCSYYEFAVEILRVAGESSPVQPTSTAAGTGAPRPANGCLGTVRTGTLPDWRQGLRDYWEVRSGAPA